MLGLCFMPSDTFNLPQNPPMSHLIWPLVLWSHHSPSPISSSPSVLSAILQAFSASRSLQLCSPVSTTLSPGTHKAPPLCYSSLLKRQMSYQWSFPATDKTVNTLNSYSLPLSLIYFSFQGLSHTTHYICPFTNCLCPLKMSAIWLQGLLFIQHCIFST